MKTSIIEQLELDEEMQAAIRREATRQGRLVNEVVREWVMEKARTVNQTAELPEKQTA